MVLHKHVTVPSLCLTSIHFRFYILGRCAVTLSSLQCWEVEGQYAHETGYAIRNPSFAGFPHVPNDVLTQSRYNNVPYSQKKPLHFASPRLL